METLKLSDLLKIGIRYFKIDNNVSTIIFNDGTKMWSKYETWNNGEGCEQLPLNLWKSR